MSVENGQEAPDFELRDQHKQPVRLSDYRGKKTVVVLFIPFAFSRVSYTFPLLSDFWPHGATAQAYGVFQERVGAPIRGSFVIDREGILRWSVVNGLPDARELDDYRRVLAEVG